MTQAYLCSSILRKYSLATYFEVSEKYLLLRVCIYNAFSLLPHDAIYYVAITALDMVLIAIENVFIKVVEFSFKFDHF